MRSSALAALVLVAGATLAGCSSAASQDDVESQISTQLEGELGSEPQDVSCPGDLAAEKGETMTCTMKVDDVEYDVKVEVTSVDDGTVNFDIEVLDPEA
jgi:ABC-type glycerol-3-phosphate transport system substrate-binding protein